MSVARLFLCLLVFVFTFFSPNLFADDQTNAAVKNSTRDPDIIRIASGSRTSTLDPTRSVFDGCIETFGQLYSRLLRRDEHGELVPGLAQSWGISADGMEYTFHLRPAKFSDGSPLTASDVAFSLKRLRDDPESAYAEPLRQMADAITLDDTTVVIKLTEPNSPFLAALEMVYLGIVSKKDLESRGREKAFATRPVTSGPYRVKEWKPNDRLTLEANPYYWREGYPLNDGAELIEVIDINTRIAMLLAGEIDAVRSLGYPQIASLQNEASVNVPYEPAIRIHIISLNHSRPPFNDIRVRQAAALALDRELMAKVLTRGIGKLANTTTPEALKFHNNAYQGWPYDLDRARRLLEDADAVGHEVVINMAAPNAQAEMVALVLQAQWAKIGLNVRIAKMDQAMDELLMMDGDYDASVNWWLNESTDPDLAVKWAVCGSCGNQSFYSFYQNDEVDRLIAEGSRSMDPDQRRKLYHRVQEVSTNEVSQIPMYYTPWLNAYSKGIEGLGMTPAMQWTLETARHLP